MATASVNSLRKSLEDTKLEEEGDDDGQPVAKEKKETLDDDTETLKEDTDSLNKKSKKKKKRKWRPSTEDSKPEDSKIFCEDPVKYQDQPHDDKSNDYSKGSSDRQHRSTCPPERELSLRLNHGSHDERLGDDRGDHDDRSGDHWDDKIGSSDHQPGILFGPELPDRRLDNDRSDSTHDKSDDHQSYQSKGHSDISWESIEHEDESGSHDNRSGKHYDRSRRHDDKSKRHKERSGSYDNKSRGHYGESRGHDARSWRDYDKSRKRDDRSNEHDDRSRGYYDKSRGHYGKSRGHDDRSWGDYDKSRRRDDRSKEHDDRSWRYYDKSTRHKDRSDDTHERSGDQNYRSREDIDRSREPSGRGGWYSRGRGFPHRTNRDRGPQKDPLENYQPKHPRSVDPPLQSLWTYHEIQGDLFQSPLTCSLAHCVSEDLHMGKGIATIFKEEFKRVDELKAQGVLPGGVAILEDNGRFIYYLVTKKRYYHKPTNETLYDSLWEMREHIIDNNVRELSMPLIGCGLDQLDWTQVSEMIKELFCSLKIEITIYYL